MCAAEPAKPWQRLDNCKLIPTAGTTATASTFVDTPEAEAEYADRVNEQAEYFGVTSSEALKLGEQASAFSKAALAGGFTIHTRWNKALGRSQEQRYYTLVYVGKADFAETLVSEGLARIYGTRTPLSDGRDSRAYLAQLATVEAGAKAARLGGWKRGPSPAAPSSPRGNPAGKASPSGSDFNQIFKKPR